MRSFFLIVGLLLSLPTMAVERNNRLGLGMSNQLQVDIPAFSFKIQKSRAFAFGGQVAISTNSAEGGYGVGLKGYRTIFEEPQLVFYSTAMGALLNKKLNGSDNSGFQFDLGLGSEFSFPGLNSIGFSFEFGVSAYKIDKFTFQTMGSNFVVAGVHFYL